VHELKDAGRAEKAGFVLGGHRPFGGGSEIDVVWVLLWAFSTEALTVVVVWGLYRALAMSLFVRLYVWTYGGLATESKESKHQNQCHQRFRCEAIRYFKRSATIHPDTK